MTSTTLSPLVTPSHKLQLRSNGVPVAARDEEGQEEGKVLKPDGSQAADHPKACLGYSGPALSRHSEELTQLSYLSL